MSRFFTYYNRIEGVRGSVLGLPAWARVALTIVALPGIVAVALSIVAFIVSLLALLAVTVPLYGLLRAMTTSRPAASDGEADFIVEAGNPRGPARHVDATVREGASNGADETKRIE